MIEEKSATEPIKGNNSNIIWIAVFSSATVIYILSPPFTIAILMALKVNESGVIVKAIGIGYYPLIWLADSKILMYDKYIENTLMLLGVDI